LQMSLGDFEKVAVLGAGAFGQVLLVRQGAKYYALKVLSKQHLLQTGLQVRNLTSVHSGCMF
jgi:serine/threonine protein kinase